MTPSARIATSIELLEAIFASWQKPQRVPADKHLDYYFKGHRFIGSHDRGAISEFVYWVIRHKASLEWHAVQNGMEPNARALAIAAVLLRGDVDAKQLATLFDDSKYAPSPLTGREREFAHHLSSSRGEAEAGISANGTRSPTSQGSVEDDVAHPDMPDHVRLNYPVWLEAELKNSLGKNLENEMRAMQEQAPVDLRTNTLKTTREALIEKLNAEGFEAEPTKLSAIGIRLKKRGPIFASPLFKEGFFEMQDEGSQAVATIVDAKPGMKVIDFCAGAGGKTLALAADMQNKGRLLAWDTSAKRLAQLPVRLRRAGVFNCEWRALTSESDAFIKRHKQTCDRVLVDAPCSGSGTWRRNPDLKWRFSLQDLYETRQVQKKISASAARLVKPGGRLIYATCSILTSENENQVEDLLKTHSNFRVVSAKKIWNKTSVASAADDVNYLSLTPHQDGVDGFFAAVLERIA